MCPFSHTHAVRKSPSLCVRQSILAEHVVASSLHTSWVGCSHLGTNVWGFLLFLVLTNGFCTCTTCSHECRSPWVNPCTDFIRRAFHLPRPNTRCPFPVANAVNHSDLPNTHFTGPVQSCCQSQRQQQSAVILKSYKLVLPPIFIQHNEYIQSSFP